jgi:hypothetical protein
MTYTSDRTGADIDKILDVNDGEFTTVDLIASTSSPVNGDTKKTLGYSSTGDGGSGLWVFKNVTGQTPSQSPTDLGQNKLNDASGNQWSLVEGNIAVYSGVQFYPLPFGGDGDGSYILEEGAFTKIFPTKAELDIVDYGAVEGTTPATDATSAFAALAADCLATGKPWVANGEYYVDKIDMYTSGRGNLTLYSSNNEESEGVVNILPDPADLGTGDFAAFNALLPLSKGTAQIPSLGVHVGKFCRISSPDLYIEREGSASSYRYELHFIVLDNLGNIYPPLPYDIPNAVNFTTFETEVIRDKVTTPNLTTILNSTGPSNLLFHSNGFNDAVWQKSAGVVLTPNYSANPVNGAVDAWLFDFGAVGVGRSVAQDVPYKGVNSGSIYLRGTSGETIKIDIRANNSSVVAQIQFVLNGSWQRIDTLASSADWNEQTDAVVQFGLRRDPPNTAQFVEVYGAQLEPARNVNDYQGTTTTQALLNGREAQVKSTRSNVEVTFNSENETGVKISQGYSGSKYKNVAINCNVSKGLIDSIEYGYNFSGCGHELISCSERWCRRGVDATYANDITVTGGHYPDGIGAHLGFNVKISNVADIGYNDANPNPLHFTGGDVKVSNSRIRTRDGAIFQPRTDAPEVIGSILIDGCDINFDWAEETGTPIGRIFAYALPAGGYTGRDLDCAKQISVTNCNVNVYGSGHTGQVELITMFYTGSITNDVIVDTGVLFDGNSYNFENGSPDLRMTANKEIYVDGSGLVIDIRDNLNLTSASFGNIKNDTVAPLVEFKAPFADSVSISADYGWLDQSVARNATYQAATGTPAYQSDSFWATRNDSGIVSLEYTIPDDSVVRVDIPSLYFTFELYQLNNISRYAKCVVDADSGGAVSEMFAGSNVANLNNTPLTGTTGSVGDISYSCDGSVVYFENRTGTTSTISVVLNNSTV